MTEKTAPSVAVIVPCFNSNAAELTKTIQSVLNQSHDDLHLVVVDDGSEVRFAGVDRQLADPRIKWLAMPANRGVAHARNQGVRESSSEFIAFLDTGDFWEPDKLEAQLEVFAANSDYDLVFCGARFVSELDASEYIRLPHTSQDWLRETLLHQPIVGSCSSVMMKRALFDELQGFDDSFELPEDRDLWVRAAQAGNIGFVARPLVHIVVKPNSRSFNVAVKLQSYQRFYQKHRALYERYNLLNEGESFYLASIAHKFFQGGSLFDGLKWSMRSLSGKFRLYVLLRALVAVLVLGNPGLYTRVLNWLRKAGQ